MDDSYQYVRKLGKGTFGDVVLYYNEKDVRYEAIKRVPNMSRRFKYEEIENHLSVLPHPNIIDLNSYSLDSSEDIAYVSLAYAPSGDMLEILRNMVMIEPIARFYFKQVLDAVDHCHSRGIVHCDIKLENLLLDGYTIKVCDFGYSQRIDAYDYTKIVGTPVYVSPEALLRKPHDGTKADVWACGVVLYCMLCGTYPYPNKELSALVADIASVNINIPKKLSQECRDFMARIFLADPIERASIHELRKHAWMCAMFD